LRNKQKFIISRTISRIELHDTIMKTPCMPENTLWIRSVVKEAVTVKNP